MTFSCSYVTLLLIKFPKGALISMRPPVGQVSWYRGVLFSLLPNYYLMKNTSVIKCLERILSYI